VDGRVCSYSRSLKTSRCSVSLHGSTFSCHSTHKSSQTNLLFLEDGSGHRVQCACVRCVSQGRLRYAERVEHGQCCKRVLVSISSASCLRRKALLVILSCGSIPDKSLSLYSALLFGDVRCCCVVYGPKPGCDAGWGLFSIQLFSVVGCVTRRWT
jgi:hypothetical protein